MAMEFGIPHNVSMAGLSMINQIHVKVPGWLREGYEPDSEG